MYTYDGMWSYKGNGGEKEYKTQEGDIRILCH